MKDETESSLRRKQLEKMAKEKPEEFAKLLRYLDCMKIKGRG